MTDEGVHLMWTVDHIMKDVSQMTRTRGMLPEQVRGLLWQPPCASTAQVGVDQGIPSTTELANASPTANELAFRLQVSASVCKGPNEAAAACAGSCCLFVCCLDDVFRAVGLVAIGRGICRLQEDQQGTSSSSERVQQALWPPGGRWV